MHTNETLFARRLRRHQQAIRSRRAMFGTLFGHSAGLALTGVSRSLLAGNETPPRQRGRIRSCIFVFYYGGPSHLDTWDPKPLAPSTVRGEFQPISTSVPGIQISEHLPQMARVMHHCAIVRSMHHTNRLHDSASTETFTGRQGPQGDREEFAVIPQFFPSHGAVVSREQPVARDAISHVALPWLIHNVVTTPCQGGGFLGQQFDPFEVSADLATIRYQVDALRQQSELPGTRIQQRTSLLNSLDQGPAYEQSMVRLQEHRSRAVELLSSTQLQKAVELQEEPLSIRERYGMKAPDVSPGHSAAAGAAGRDLRGQNLLLARRLVEAGIPFINVNDFRQQGQNWDSHADNFTQHSRYLLPQADRALAALIEDLHERGLLESTLVVACGEFGRTPTINGSAGRDHWPDCYSILLAGGGIQGGQVYGSSDRIGAFPETNPVTPADLAATIFDRFGIDPSTDIHDTTGRPWRLSSGAPIPLA
ncbi:MAG: DUF1501 domain-containing protein [Planctomycetaceae bacterium]